MGEEKNRFGKAAARPAGRKLSSPEAKSLTGSRTQTIYWEKVEA
jgi:hypothetical protein